jgi:AcrR family transcriptional regulator
MPASRQRRSYDSPLRAEQMDRTREKLIEAAIDVQTEEGGDKLTVRLVAARAGVSVPTAYRYFPDRDALFDAMAVAIRERFAGPVVPATLDGLPAWVRHIYAGYASNDRLLRAQLNTPVGRLLRAKNQKARNPKLVEMTKRSLSSATPTTQQRLTALMHLLVHAPAWVALHDQWGMSGVEAGNVTTWAVETLLAEIRRHPSALDFELAAPSTKKRRGPAREK